MQLLIFLDPDFWKGVLIAAWALYGDRIVLGVIAFIAIGAFVTYFVRYVLKAKGGKK